MMQLNPKIQITHYIQAAKVQSVALCDIFVTVVAGGNMGTAQVLFCFEGGTIRF
jgi:hypothetical protein